MIRTSLRRRSALRDRLESLEVRSLMTLTATGQTILGVVGKGVMSQVATFTDTDATLMSTDLSASINWGDGTTSSGAVSSISGTNYAVNGVHTYANFSAAAGYPVLILIQDAKNSLSATADSTAVISDAPLHAGNPVSAGTAQQFTGVGPVNVAATIANFRSAIGGTNNTSIPAPQSGGGSRAINWDDVAPDGTDAGGPPNTTVIAQGTTVAIPRDRYETEGVYFDSTYAVSGNGFNAVNPNVASLLPAYSGGKVVAPFNSNTIGLSFVAPGVAGTAPAAAAVKGFGAVFLNVERAGATTIQYFDGDRSLGQFSAPVGTAGQPEFLGELFTNAVVTRVEITLGTDALFSFNGVNFAAGTAADAPATGHNLVAADDFIFAEPTPIANAGTVLNGAAGTSTAAPVAETVGASVPAVVASFSSDNPGASPKNYTAEINWGDGHLTSGTVGLNAQGGFDVTGSNAYAASGSYPVTTTVTSFGGASVSVTNTAAVSKAASGSFVTLQSSANPALPGQPVSFQAIVPVNSPAGLSLSGYVTFYDGTTALGSSPLVLGIHAGTYYNTASYTTTTLSGGSHAITAQYGGNDAYNAGTSAVLTQVVNPDVTSTFGINLGGFKSTRAGFVQRVTIKNNSGVSVAGPIDLVLDGLASGVTLKNATGSVRSTAPTGGPYITFALGTSNTLAAGQTTYVDLVFGARRPRLIAYKARVLAGLAQP